jgi:hypothetical protein
MDQELTGLGGDCESCDICPDSIWNDLEQLDRLARAVSFFVGGQVGVARQSASSGAEAGSLKVTMFAFGVAEEMMRLAGIRTRDEEVAKIVYLSMLVGGEHADALKLTRLSQTLATDPDMNVFALYGRTAVRMLVREESDAMQMLARALGEKTRLRQVN